MKYSALLLLLFSIFPRLSLANGDCNLNKDQLQAYEQLIMDHCDEISSTVCGVDFSTLEDDLSAYFQSNRSQLSADEMVAITAYTFDFYKSVNGSLRKHDGNITAYLPIMNCALSKLPDVETDVYRNDNIPDLVLSSWQEGQIITYDSYMSTTTIPNKCATDPDEVYCANTHQYLTIHSKHGKNISMYSGYPEESEVLFAPGTKFLVEKREPLFDGKLSIILREQ